MAKFVIQTLSSFLEVKNTIMDKIQLLQERKEKLMQASKEIREDINAIVDELSFVESSAFSFSKNDFYV